MLLATRKHLVPSEDEQKRLYISSWRLRFPDRANSSHVANIARLTPHVPQTLQGSAICYSQAPRMQFTSNFATPDTILDPTLGQYIPKSLLGRKLFTSQFVQSQHHSPSPGHAYFSTARPNRWVRGTVQQDTRRNVAWED